MNKCPKCGSIAIEVDHVADSDYCDSCGFKELKNEEPVNCEINHPTNQDESKNI